MRINCVFNDGSKVRMGCEHFNLAYKRCEEVCITVKVRDGILSCSGYVPRFTQCDICSAIGEAHILDDYDKSVVALCAQCYNIYCYLRVRNSSSNALLMLRDLVARLEQ